MELIALLIAIICLFRFRSLKGDLIILEDRIRTLERQLFLTSQESWAAKSKKSKTVDEQEETAHALMIKPDELINDTSENLKREEKNTGSEKISDEEYFGYEEEYFNDTATKRPSYSKVNTAEWKKLAQLSFEKNIATKLPVWIGAVSLVFAAFFLVKYSIELGWLGPGVRVFLGSSFGAILLLAGQWVGRHEKIANSVRIAQGLVGAGLVALYVSLYAGINLYALFSPVIGFASMVIVTSLAVILSLRHGQPIAVFGLFGGLITPALIGSQEPNAMVMFSYLFLLFTAMFIVLVQQGWWFLALLAVVGVFSWTVIWFLFVFALSDAFILVLFAMAICAVVFSVTGRKVADGSIEQKDRLPIHSLNTASIAGGALTIIWLNFELALTLFDWSMLGLLSVALVALSYFQPKVYQKPLIIKIAASLFLFFGWAHNAPLSNTVVVLLGLAFIYVGLSTLVMRKVKDPRFWCGVQVFSALSLYIISYYVLELPEALLHSFGVFWGITSLMLASLLIYQTAEIIKNYKVDEVICDHLVAISSLGASFFISIGLVVELPWENVPLAFAAQIAATAWVYKKTRIEFLKKIMVALGACFVFLHYQQILLFITIVLSSLIGEAPDPSFASEFVIQAPLIKLGVPAIFIGLSLYMVTRTDKEDKQFIHMFFGLFLFLFLATLYYLLRGVFNPEQAYYAITLKASFIERGVITHIIIVLALSIIYLCKRLNNKTLDKWGYGLFHTAILRFMYFDLLIMNPYFSNSQNVGDVIFFNGITLTYGLGGMIIVWAIYNLDLKNKFTLYKALGFSFLFVFVTLTVRQYFHGGILQGATPSAELYAYSVVWMFTGVALLAFGIKLSNRTARMASLVFLIFTVLKVFLFDAAELEGLYRVFSFLGLGVSLIGLSYFYTKFVFKSEQMLSERVSD